MKKLIILLPILFYVSINAQTEQRGIELPDFVITGRQTVDVQAAQKKKPELISMLSEDFFTPAYSPEELPLLISSSPKPSTPEISAAGDYFSGSVLVGLGSYTYPTGLLNISAGVDNYLVSAKAWGTNIKSYVANAGYNISGVALNNNIFISTKSDFLPGTVIGLNGEYTKDLYKFYASTNPFFERQNSKGFGEFTIHNSYNRWVNFGLNLKAGFLTMNENSLNEKNLNVGSVLEIKLGKFILGGEGLYQRQILQNNLSGIDGYDYYSTEGYVKINPMQNLRLKAGFNLASNTNNTFFTPFASAQYQFAKGFVLDAEFKPHAVNYTIADFLKQNMYMINGTTDNVFSEVNIDLNAKLKFEYDKYFSIGLWGKFSKTDNYLYFEDILRNGFFNVRTANDVKTINGGVNFIINPGIFGYFSGEAGIQEVTDINGKYIPYIPRYSSSFTYGYNFPFGVNIKADYQFASGTYADINNIFELRDYHNVSLQIGYKIWESLSITADFQNVLNRSNFVLRQYEEKPLDLIVSVEYRW